MLRNYVKIAIRNLLKHKVFSFINILGLSIGITCCVLLALFIRDEFSYEKHFQDHDHIYRITSTIIATDKTLELPGSSPPITMTMLREFPELESAVRVVKPIDTEQFLLKHGDETFYEKTGYLVDSTFFDVFSYAFAEGDRNTALDAPSTVVLSHKVARKIFAGRSPLDELLIINSGSVADTFRVTGVLEPYRNPSQLDADLYMCMHSGGWGDVVNSLTTWAGNNFVSGFIKLNPQTSAAGVEAKLAALLEKHGSEELRLMGFQKTLNLQALDDMHLYSANEFTQGYDTMDIGTRGNITYVYMLGSICFFILLIACINFMNLTTAKASQRAGEVGIRKSLGANRLHLIKQFLGESLTIVLVAMVISFGLTQLMLPLFNQFTQKDLSVNGQNIAYVFGALAGISLITGFIAGSYPAFFLSAFQPARVLKDRHLSQGSGLLRKSLVVFQFVISISLISAIVIITKQLNFVQNKSLGFSAEHRVAIPLRTSEAKAAYDRLKDRFKLFAGVKEVSASTAMPGSKTINDLLLYPEGSSAENALHHFSINIDENYFSTLDIDLVAGRKLQQETDGVTWEKDDHRALINLASVQALGMTPEKATGTRLYFDWQGRKFSFQVVGVVEDFHQFSLHEKITPLLFIIPADRNRYVELLAAVDGRDYKNTLALMQDAWKEVVPDTPFEHTLLTDHLKQQYEADRRMNAIITAFTIIALFISCLGLYGLSIYVAERRVKEIGIRKILGASVSSIVNMLTKDFIKLIIIAFVLAIPVGYYVMNKWLEGFAYKITLDVTIFVIAGVVSFLIAWLTVGFESIRAAMNNPVDSLKKE